jgi:hypothetical protein
VRTQTVGVEGEPMPSTVRIQVREQKHKLTVRVDEPFHVMGYNEKFV